jgi:NAD(P)-dependent dehydrogenase (short-subunit alcohol dehydrogenase family)
VQFRSRLFRSSFVSVQIVGIIGIYAAIGGLTRALAVEFAMRRVRVNEMLAGAVQTPMHDGIVKNLDENFKDALSDLHLLGFGKPSVVAAVAAFVSDASPWITGSSMAVDGGYTAA